MENDYLPASEATPQPRTTTPRTFGILNIIFSLMAGLFSLYSLAMALMMPMLSEAADRAQQETAKARQQQIAKLEADEAAAETDEEKTRIAEQRKQLEQSGDMQGFDPLGAMRDPKVMAYSLVDGATGLLLNLLMFISGIGLLSYREWARKLAVWTAVLKIVRLVILQLVNVAVIIPITAAHMQKMFEQMGANNPGMGPGAAGFDMARMQGMMSTVWALAMLLIGSVYPALVWWFLTRPNAKAACQAEASH